MFDADIICAEPRSETGAGSTTGGRDIIYPGSAVIQEEIFSIVGRRIITDSAIEESAAVYRTTLTVRWRIIPVSGIHVKRIGETGTTAGAHPFFGRPSEVEATGSGIVDLFPGSIAYIVDEQLAQQRGLAAPSLNEASCPASGVTFREALLS